MEFFSKITTIWMFGLIVVVTLFNYASCDSIEEDNRLQLDKINDLDSWFRCPEGWLLSSNSGKCLRVFNANQSWEESRDFCREYGGDLASLHSETDFVVVKTLVSEDIWIGLNDIDTDGVYVWSDGSAVNFTSWASGEPNNMNGTENCAIMSKYADFNFTEEDCSEQKRFICEKPRDEELPVYRCLQSWIMNSNSSKCFHVVNIAHSWQDSLNLCREFGGDLASLHSGSDFILAKSLVSVDTWIGLNDLAIKGVYEWSDSSDVDFVSWASGQPDNKNDSESCVDMHSGWNFDFDDDFCNLKESLLCEKIPDALYRCPEGWTPNPDSSKCFREMTSYSREWGTCQTVCREIAGNLASLHSEAELEIAKDLMAEDTWIGLNDIATENVFEWNDGSPVDFTSWGTDQPDNGAKHGEDCVEMRASHDFDFNDSQCDSHKWCLCQIINQVVKGGATIAQQSLDSELSKKEVLE